MAPEVINIQFGACLHIFVFVKEPVRKIPITDTNIHPH